MSIFEKVIKKVKRYCKTIGFPEPTVRIKGDKIEYSLVNSDNFNKIRKTFDWSEMEKALKEDFKKVGNLYTTHGGEFYLNKARYTSIELTIVDEVKPLEEWVILGTIDYKDGILNPAPGKQIPHDLIPDKIKGSSYCTHCNSNRMRNKIVFIQNESDGKTIQVGGSCIKYYLGYDYEKVLTLIESIDYLYNSPEIFEYEGEGYGMSRPPVEYSASDIIKYYIWYVNHHKSHTTKKQAEAYNEKITPGSDEKKYKKSTSNSVYYMLMSVYNPPIQIDYNHKNSGGSTQYEMDYKEWEKGADKFYNDIKSVSDADYKEVIEFINSKAKDSNFMFNVSNLIKEGTVTEKYMNYISGACSYFFSVKISSEAKAEAKAERDSLNSKKAANSNHIGTTGEKTAFENVTIKKIKGFETEFGWSNVYNLEDETGNTFVKFGTINKKFLVDDKDTVEEGSVLSFTADIKKHGEFNGVKQTTLGRLSKFNPSLKY